MGTYQRDCFNKVTLSIYINNMMPSPTLIQTWYINGTFSVTTKTNTNDILMWHREAAEYVAIFTASLSILQSSLWVLTRKKASWAAACQLKKRTFQGVRVEGRHIHCMVAGYRKAMGRKVQEVDLQVSYIFLPASDLKNRHACLKPYVGLRRLSSWISMLRWRQRCIANFNEFNKL